MSSQFNEMELYGDEENYTLARLANNNNARRLGSGGGAPRQCTDKSARGARPDGTIGFSARCLGG